MTDMTEEKEMKNQRIISVAKAYAQFDKPQRKDFEDFSIYEEKDQVTVVLDRQNDSVVPSKISYAYSIVLTSDEITICENKATYCGQMLQNQFEGYSQEEVCKKKFTIDEGCLKMVVSEQVSENDTNKIESSFTMKNRTYFYEISKDFCLCSEDIATLKGTKKLSK